VDPITGEHTVLALRKAETIVKADQHPVLNKEELTIPAQFRAANQNFSAYLEDRLKAIAKNIPDSIAQIQVNHVVLDGQGKIIYFDLVYINTTVTRVAGMHNSNSTLDPVMETIISNSPAWLPGTKNGATVYTYLEDAGTIGLKDISSTHVFEGKVQQFKGSDGSKIIQSEGETITFPKQK